MPEQTRPPIFFHFLKTGVRIANRTGLKNFIASIFREYGLKIKAINYIFCTDEYLLQLNRTYLRHNTYTDIITFDLSGAGGPIEADIYISIDRVLGNSSAFGVRLSEEIHRVMFHGVLHLCGLKDKKSRDQKRMRMEEDRLLAKYRFHVKRSKNL